MSDEILYHPKVFIPDWFVMPTERVRLVYTRHALVRCAQNRIMPVFQTIPLSQFELVELGVRDSKVNQLGMPARRVVSKIVVRGHFDSTRDIIFVLIPKTNEYVVKTCWFNDRKDKHTTLRTERYATA